MPAAKRHIGLIDGAHEPAAAVAGAVALTAVLAPPTGAIFGVEGLRVAFGGRMSSASMSPRAKMPAAQVNATV
jgi:hypothetical protein